MRLAARRERLLVSKLFNRGKNPNPESIVLVEPKASAATNPRFGE